MDNQHISSEISPAFEVQGPSQATPDPLANESLHKALDGQPDDWDAVHPTAATPLRFSFSGRGKDYLSLWLTNWILTIVTLGIYSAWAKVRRLQYVHQNTQLGGFAFGFHGEPKKILIGRIIGIGLIFISNATNIFGAKLAGFFSLMFIIAFPWLYRSSIRFYTRNSSYRNVRFRFVGTAKAMYSIYLKSALIVIFTAGWAFPYVVYRLRRYRIEHSRWGNNAFQFSSSAGAFFGIYILNIVVTALVMLGLMALAFASSSSLLKGLSKEISNIMTHPTQSQILIMAGLYLLFIYMVYVIGRVLTQDLIFKESWNHIAIGKSRFACDLSIVRLYFIRYGCFIASLLTLGIFIPFAHMIITKRRIESISVTPSHDFDVAQATLDEDTTRSAEVADMFDIDIGW
ncbi:hypothetical protein DTO96_101514 [Ephemeroptericola cinctiostellae]|uniref:Inner membrane protein YjgN n=1 Tax=Ephemeroptericola cinctiostellae TaxID=2268024 RepID=A0A345DBP0_9BURK|nr:YjgN family protein [Ephemeroptericola cinctiostellae]AXF85778.1 hypothetical protein DTO96_101514 [Ephemeroptericola cinctiostellae]